MACTACHTAKVKCVGGGEGLPCERCKRLGLQCVLHKSRQGQGKKKRKKNTGAAENVKSVVAPSRPDNAKIKRNGSSADSFAKDKNEKHVTESVIVSNTAKLGPDHFGLYFIIRQWVAFAIVRRSLNLLGRACSLACKCGISMDDIICGCSRFASVPRIEDPVGGAVTASTNLNTIANHTNQNNNSIAGVPNGDANTNPLFMALAIHTQASQGSGMDFLTRVITTKAKDQQTIGPPLQLTEIPIRLLSAIYCCPSLSNLSGRWVMVREMKDGMSRFFVSEQFQRDIATYELIEQTYKENVIEVKDIWTKSNEEKFKHSQGLIHQISMQRTFDTLPHPARIVETKITLSSGLEIACDCIVCMVIVGLDHCYYFVEYHSPRPVGASNKKSVVQSAVQQDVTSAPEKRRESCLGRSRNAVMELQKQQQQQQQQLVQQQQQQQTSVSVVGDDMQNLTMSSNSSLGSSQSTKQGQQAPFNTEEGPLSAGNDQFDDYNDMVGDLEWSDDLNDWLNEMEMSNLF